MDDIIPTIGGNEPLRLCLAFGRSGMSGSIEGLKWGHDVSRRFRRLHKAEQQEGAGFFSAKKKPF